MATEQNQKVDDEAKVKTETDAADVDETKAKDAKKVDDEAKVKTETDAADVDETKAKNAKKDENVNGSSDLENLKKENLALKSEKLMSRISWFNDEELALFNENFGSIDIDVQTKFVDFLQNFENNRKILNKKQNEENINESANADEPLYL